MATRLREAAIEWLSAGCSVIPVHADAEHKPDLVKRPTVAWKPFIAHPPTAVQVSEWFGDGALHGVAVICGTVSGRLEVLDIEGRAVDEGFFDKLGEVLKSMPDAKAAWQRVRAGYVEQTPSGGWHLLWRIADDGSPMPGNLKLARRPATEEELAAKPGDRFKVLAETRGEGGYIVAAPTPGTAHESGRPWRAGQGMTPGMVVTLSRAERDALIGAVRALDECAPPQNTAVPARSVSPYDPAGGSTPGDDFEARTGWGDALLLGGAGWRRVWGRDGGTVSWCRPGKEHGVSATTGYAGDRDRLWVFSSSTEFETERPYTKFGAYALLHHAGDHAAAARRLAELGYGEREGLPAPGGGHSADPWPIGPQRGSEGPQTTAAASSAADGQPGFAQIGSEFVKVVDTPDVAAYVAPEEGVAYTDPAELIREAEQWERQQREKQLIEREAGQIRLRRAARRLVDAEEALGEFEDIPDATGINAVLDAPREAVRHRIAEVMPSGSNTLLTAQYKTGKTTLVLNLVKALLDPAEAFLGRYETTPLDDGRAVAHWNYEVNGSMIAEWYEGIGGLRDTALHVVNLRGRRMPLIVPEIQRKAVAWLQSKNVGVWIVDPLAPAFVGCGDENSNTDMAAFLGALDAIKTQAGISELVLVTHTGRGHMDAGAERARGATRLDDWPDVRWLLVADENRTRYFRATGRDVDTEEQAIQFDFISRKYTLAGAGRSSGKVDRWTARIIEFVEANPNCTSNAILDGIGGSNRSEMLRLLKRLENEGRLVVLDGPNRSRLHRLSTAQGLGW